VALSMQIYMSQEPTSLNNIRQQMR
jgi:hypothetical protein